MKKLNLLFLILLVSSTLFINETNAQCTDEKNILLFTNSSGATIPDSDFIMTNTTDEKAKVTLGSASGVRYTQGSMGDVQIEYQGSTRYFIDPNVSFSGTDTYTNFFLHHNGKLYHSKGNVSGVGSNDSYKPYQISNVIGNGTEATPYRMRVKFYADVDDTDGASYVPSKDILVTKTVSYVTGEKYTRNDYVINNPTNFPAKVYEQRDEQYGTNDAGLGLYAQSNSDQLQPGTGTDHASAGVFTGLVALVNAEKEGSSNTPGTNTKIVGFSTGQDGSSWLSWQSAYYQHPYETSGRSIPSGQPLSNKIVRNESDIGFAVQLPDAAANTTTTLTLYEMVGVYGDICAAKLCTAPTYTTSGDNAPTGKICPSGETIVMTASSSGVTSPEYAFYKDGTVVQAYSTTNTYNITSAGIYTVKVKGTDCNESAASTPLVITAATPAECNPPAAGSVDCDKIMVFTMPTAGTASNHTIRIPVNITTAGEVDVTISGSGFTIIGGSPYKYSATSTGQQFIDVPVKYDGSALGTATVTTGSLTNSPCTIDMTDNTAVKDAVIKVWSKDCLPTCGPKLK